jgi:hypothetical protein
MDLMMRIGMQISALIISKQEKGDVNKIDLILPCFLLLTPWRENQYAR